MGSVFKRKQRGATVGTEMDGRDRATPVGQLVVAGRTNRRRGLGSRSNRGSERENVRAKGGSFEF
jgi:hypothetical protein